MEFDKNRILTCVTGSKELVGKKGWFADSINILKEKVVLEKPTELISFNKNNSYPFRNKQGYTSFLFYPAQEPTYAERQAQWIKENNVKEGTKVRVTRTFTDDEDGSCCFGHDDLVGKTGIIRNICSLNLGVDIKDRNFKVVPYFALEVIKEPTYRPYNNDELNDLVGEVLTNKQSGRRKVVTGKPTASEGVNLDGSYITAKDLLASFYRNGNKPCGVKEEV
jgi:hypothetical protein